MGRQSEQRWIREAIAAEKLAAEWEEQEAQEAIAEAIEAEARAAELEAEHVADKEQAEEQKLIDESEFAVRYTEKLHVSIDWAFKVLEWDDPGIWPQPPHPRVINVRATIVREADNEEEAYDKALPIERLDDWVSSVDAPGRELGGVRRVIIQLFTWLIDRKAGVAHAPEWIKFGEGLSCKSAAAGALRAARVYAEALAKGAASKEMRMTIINIAIWTAVDEVTDYV